MAKTAPTWEYEAYYLQDRAEVFHDRRSWRRTPLITRRALARAFWGPMLALHLLVLPLVLLRTTVHDVLTIDFVSGEATVALFVFAFVTAPILLVRAAWVTAGDWFRARG